MFIKSQTSFVTIYLIVLSALHLALIFVEEISEIPENSTVIFSAHGVSPLVWEEAQKNNELEITNDDHEETQDSFGEITFRNLDVFAEYNV